MISTLHIKNIGIIDDISIDLNNGFNVLTGETGAGKTLIIDSLSIVCGNRFSKEISLFIEEAKNRSKYLIEENGVIMRHCSIFECGNLGVETEAQDIQFNVLKIFID